jgi:hypothetical protein
VIPRNFGSLGLRKWIFGACALLSAGAAQGQAASKAEGKVGNWEVTAEENNRCTIKRLYGNDIAKPPQGGLVLMYDPRAKDLAFAWASIKPTYLPGEGDQDFGIAFVTGRSVDVSWGHPSFSYKKRLDTYYFTHVFSGEVEVERFLHDVTSNEGLVFFYGPTPVVGFTLDAAGAVEKLRACASKVEGAP